MLSYNTFTFKKTETFLVKYIFKYKFFFSTKNHKISSLNEVEHIKLIPE